MITINYQGIEITVSSPQEAAAVAKELALSQNATPNKPVSRGDVITATCQSYAPKISSPIQKPFTLSQPASETQQIADFLQAIVDAGEAGTTAEALMPILGTQSPKGLGGRMVRVNNIIEACGYDADAVYNNESRGIQGRIWRAGPMAEHVVGILRALDGKFE